MIDGKDQHLYLTDLLERIQRIEAFTIEGPRAFEKSLVTQDAVIRNFEVIGEIVKRLDKALTTLHPEVAWSGFAGFRDVLIHRYDNVVLGKVWETIVEDMPALKSATLSLLKMTHPDD